MSEKKQEVKLVSGKDSAQLVREMCAKFGDHALMRMDQQRADIPCVSSGSYGLDRALGGRGYPRGRIIELYGPEASGKTTLTLHAIAEAQKAGGLCAFIDAEHALDVNYARNLGVNVEELLISQPDNGEQALNIAEELAGSGTVSCVVIDSVAALVPRSELEGEVGDPTMGVQARMMSQALRKITPRAGRTGCTVFFINQLRSKIGVIFGSPEVTTGGNALKFYASVRLDVRRRTQIKDSSDDPTGNKMEVKVVKNKIAPPFKDVLLDVHWGRGIDRAADLLSVGVQEGVISKSGNWYERSGQRLGNGFASAAAALREQPTIRADVERALGYGV